ncbi:hypothetical protein ACFLW7_03420 [Chloroflexota bacterium]
MEDYRRPLVDQENGNSPDLVAKAVRFVLREQDKREEHLTVLGSANGIASTRDESLEKIVIEPTFSQGGEHEIRNDSYSCRG